MDQEDVKMLESVLFMLGRNHMYTPETMTSKLIPIIEKYKKNEKREHVKNLNDMLPTSRGEVVLRDTVLYLLEKDHG